MRLISMLVLAACAPTAPQPPTTPSTATAKPCEGPEHRQLDFWIGDWSAAIRSRPSQTSDQWTDQAGTQHITRTLSGCAIEENFSALPPAPWGGRSFAAFDAITNQWRQTWVDDGGGYLAFTGGPDGSDFIFTGEQRAGSGAAFQMRMVFSKITHDKIHWEWQRSEDAWQTHAVVMTIDYTRLAAH